MRVRVWNAYASNNSGSYTIVGVLPSNEVAREVAEGLATMIDAHTRWVEAEPSQRTGSESPLAAFCRAHGLNGSPGVGEDDDWPEHRSDNRPRVAAVGDQVVVHHEYTVSLPPVFGAYFYKRGGRVQVEENHAHHPIVTIATYWWGWSKQERAKGEIELPRLLAALAAPEGVLTQRSLAAWPAAWRPDEDGPALVVGMIFENLIDGVSALGAAGKEYGAQMQLRLQEAADDNHDPLVHMRPSQPPTARFDVVLTEQGDDSDALIEAVMKSLSYSEWQARELLADRPQMLARGIPEARAESIAVALREAGAKLALVRNDA